MLLLSIISVLIYPAFGFKSCTGINYDIHMFPIEDERMNTDKLQAEIVKLNSETMCDIQVFRTPKTLVLKIPKQSEWMITNIFPNVTSINFTATTNALSDDFSSISPSSGGSSDPGKCATCTYTNLAANESEIIIYDIFKNATFIIAKDGAGLKVSPLEDILGKGPGTIKHVNVSDFYTHDEFTIVPATTPLPVECGNYNLPSGMCLAQRVRVRSVKYYPTLDTYYIRSYNDTVNDCRHFIVFNWNNTIHEDYATYVSISRRTSNGIETKLFWDDKYCEHIGDCEKCRGHEILFIGDLYLTRAYIDVIVINISSDVSSKNTFTSSVVSNSLLKNASLNVNTKFSLPQEQMNSYSDAKEQIKKVLNWGNNMRLFKQAKIEFPVFEKNGAYMDEFEIPGNSKCILEEGVFYVEPSSSVLTIIMHVAIRFFDVNNEGGLLSPEQYKPLFNFFNLEQIEPEFDKCGYCIKGSSTFTLHNVSIPLRKLECVPFSSFEKPFC